MPAILLISRRPGKIEWGIRRRTWGEKRDELVTAAQKSAASWQDIEPHTEFRVIDEKHLKRLNAEARRAAAEALKPTPVPKEVA